MLPMVEDTAFDGHVAEDSYTATCPEPSPQGLPLLLLPPRSQASPRPMSQLSRGSTFTACGELGPDEAIETIFAQRRRTGGRLEYNCDLRGGSEPRWLAAAAVDADSLSAWEIVRATKKKSSRDQ
jgi:D-alanyl-D-alanine carboxypeptidase